jgi:hypothetical protein
LDWVIETFPGYCNKNQNIVEILLIVYRRWTWKLWSVCVVSNFLLWKELYKKENICCELRITKYQVRGSENIKSVLVRILYSEVALMQARGLKHVKLNTIHKELESRSMWASGLKRGAWVCQ